MSRKYSSWASNQPSLQPDLSTMMRLTTVGGNEQDQLKNFQRVEAIPHMYINVDAPPPPSTKLDARAVQSNMMQNHHSTCFAASNVIPPPGNAQTKMWPVEKLSRNSSIFESGSSTSKRTHKHKHHHHHHHHSDKHHHHRHHSRRHRARSAESIRNRQNRSSLSSSKVMLANPQYIEQDQQQQQPMIVYREVQNGDGYTVDPNAFANVPYGSENETTVIDDQQTPVVVYRDPNHQQSQHQSFMADGLSQDIFYNQDQDENLGEQSIPLQPIVNKLISHRVAPVNETQVNSYSPYICTQAPTSMNCNINYIQEIERIYIEEDCCPPLSMIIQQSDPFMCHPQQQQSSQIVYCTDPNQQDYFCSSNNANIIHQSITPHHHQQQQQQFVCVDNTPQHQQQQFVCVDNTPQQQFVCVDNTPTTIQPTIINQIPVFNSLATNANSQQMVSLPQTSLQRAASVIIQQPQPQPLQIIQQPQPFQVIQQPQSLQVIQQPQQLQFIPNQQAQHGQFLQLSSPTPQMIQTIQPQLIQAPSVLQTFQMPAQGIAATPQILYQRPYDPVAMPFQNQQMAIANPSLVALSQPSYAPARIAAAGSGVQSQGPNMFRHALLQTVAGRTGVPIPSAASGAGAIQMMQPTVATAGAANANFVLAGNLQRSSSLPIVPLTPGGLLIPFQPSQTPGLRHGPFSHAGGHPSNLRNFNDIRQHIQQQRAQLLQNLQQQQQNYNRIPSPPVISAAQRNQSGPYTPGNMFSGNARSGGTPFPSGAPSTYAGPPSSRLSYAQPSFAGSSIGSTRSAPYYPLRS